MTQFDNTEEAKSQMLEELLTALQQSSPSLGGFNWTMSNTEDEGDVLTLEVVLSTKKEATTYDMLALLDNIAPEELLEIMVTKKIEEVAGEETDFEEAEFREVGDSNE